MKINITLTKTDDPQNRANLSLSCEINGVVEEYVGDSPEAAFRAFQGGLDKDRRYLVSELEGEMEAAEEAASTLLAKEAEVTHDIEEIPEKPVKKTKKEAPDGSL